MDKQMKIGTIGTGEIVEKFIAAVKGNQGAECKAVYSRSKEKAESFGTKLGISKTYCQIEELWDDEEINFVYIGSPNSLHYQYAKEAMEQGKNVICEKPFTSNAGQLSELIQLSKDKKVFLFEAITTIHLPNVKYIKEKIELVGSVKLIRSNFSQFSNRYSQLVKGKMTNVFDLNFSGGCLTDINIYNIHFVMNLFGVPKKVTYFANQYHTGIDTSGIALLEYDGFLAECCGSKDTEGENSCEIQGTEGYIRVNSQVSRSTDVTLNLKGHPKVEYNDQEEENALFYEVKDFVKVFKEEDFTKCHQWLDHSLDVMKVLDSARESAGIKFPSDKL